MLLQQKGGTRDRRTYDSTRGSVWCWKVRHRWGEYHARPIWRIGRHLTRITEGSSIINHQSSVTGQICAVVTHNANQLSSTVWAIWGLIYYNNSPKTHTCKSLTAITHSHSFTYGIYNVWGNYPATDFARLSLLVSIVLIVARIT